MKGLLGAAAALPLVPKLSEDLFKEVPKPPAEDIDLKEIEPVNVTVVPFNMCASTCVMIGSLDGIPLYLTDRVPYNANACRGQGKSRQR